MFNFSWFAGLVDGLKPHPLPLCSQKNEMLLFWITLNFWWLARLSDGLKPHPPSLSSQKMKCSFLYYFELLMISQAGQWTQTPSASPLQPIKWNAHFWIMFNFWWSAGLVEELKPHPSPLSTQKHEMLIFGSCSTSDDWPGWSMDCNPICHPSPAKNMKCYFLDYAQLLMIGWAHQWTQTPSSTPLQPKKWNAHFWIMFNFWWLAGLVNGLKPHPPPLSSQKNEMLLFGLCSLLMIGQAGWLTQTPSATPLQTKKWNAHILIMFNFWWLARLVNGLEPHPPLLSRQKKWNASFWITFTSDDLPGWLMNLNLICHPSLTKKNEMHNFWLRSTSDDQPSWSIDLKSICQPSQANKMKCSFFGYVQLLMISRAVQWTQTPSATPLQPIKWNAHFWITFNFWWSARLVNGLEPHPSPLSSQKKMKYLFLD